MQLCPPIMFGGQPYGHSLASASYLGSTFDSITFAGSSEDFNATKSDFITTKSDLGSDFYLSTMPPPSADPAAVHASIESRLDALRAELNTLMPPPATPTPPWTTRRVVPPLSKDEKVLLYMPFFETAKIRAARLSLTGKKGKNGDVGKTNPALKRPPSVSPRPAGYRIDSKHPSSPAITMAQQWVRSPKTDPTMPEDFPGPGAYDLIKY